MRELQIAESDHFLRLSGHRGAGNGNGKAE
jgi:hypothetical protein